MEKIFVFFFFFTEEEISGHGEANLEYGDRGAQKKVTTNAFLLNHSLVVLRTLSNKN